MCVCAQRKALRVLPAAQGTALPRPLCCRRCREHTEEGGEARPAPLLLPRPPPAPPSAPFPSRSLPGMLPGPHGQIPSARHQLPQAEPARTHTVTGLGCSAPRPNYTHCPHSEHRHRSSITALGYRDRESYCQDDSVLIICRD